MARRSEHSLEELKAMVLDAAETIVIEEGFSSLKARRVAVEIGYTVGSIYMVYKNMADLITHINAKTLDAVAAQLEQVQDGDPAQYIEAIAQAYLVYASRNFNRWIMIFEYGFSRNTDIPDWYQEKRDVVFDRLEESVAQLAPECAESDRKQAAKALWNSIHGICILSLSGKTDTIDLNESAETMNLLIRSFIHGWLAQSAKATD
ncbi:MAG: TetR/AcrR family transcriptional regulator [Methylococcales bacterium]|nr:TetR/AcrR family transcriptional regulator [Methylococcales bacterium]